MKIAHLFTLAASYAWVPRAIVAADTESTHGGTLAKGKELLAQINTAEIFKDNETSPVGKEMSDFYELKLKNFAAATTAAAEGDLLSNPEEFHMVLGRLEEATNVVDTLVSIIDKDDSLPSVLKDLVNSAAEQVKKSSNMTANLALSMMASMADDDNKTNNDSAATSSATDHRKLGNKDSSPDHRHHHETVEVDVDAAGKTTNMDDASATTRRQKSRSEPTHSARKKLQHPIANHPRFKNHEKIHDALESGDIGFLHQKLDRIHAKTFGMGANSGGGSEDSKRRRRRRLLQATTPTPAESRATAVRNCVELVKCVRTWTLYDVITYFYWDDITEAGEITNSTHNFDANSTRIVDKVKEIRDALAMFPTGADRNIKNTFDLNQKCNGLLRLFHRNEEKKDYTEYKASSWMDVCRGQGATRYVSFAEIGRIFGESIADKVFEDSVICAYNLDTNNHVFFDPVNNAPRVPTGVRSASLDRHGRIGDPYNLFTYQNVDVVEGIARAEYMEAQLTGGLDVQRLTLYLIPDFYQLFGAELALSATCRSAINGHYRSLLTEKSPYVYDEAARTYPDLVIHFRLHSAGVAAGTEKYMVEDIRPAGLYYPLCTNEGPFQLKTKVKNQWHVAVESHKVNTVFASTPNKDKAMSYLLGDEVSNGLVCAHKTLPGYCCLDSASQNQGPASWGMAHTCSLGKSACATVAPPLAGFTKSTCDMYGGTFCLYPRDCTSLKTCIKNEYDWAVAENKYAFRGYVEEAMTITDPNDQQECGEAREYLGFDHDYPDDNEICEDLHYLRYNRDFDALDAFATAGTASISTPAPAPAFLPPETIPKTDPQIAGTHQEIFRNSQRLQVIESVLSGVEAFDCDIFFADAAQTVCAATQMVIILALIVTTSFLEYVDASFENTYIVHFTPSDFNAYEVWSEVKVIRQNMQIMYERNDVVTGNVDTNVGLVLTEAQGITTEIGKIEERVTKVIKDRCPLPTPVRRLEDADRTLSDDESATSCDVSPVLKAPQCLGYRASGPESIVKLTGHQFQSKESALTFLAGSLEVSDSCADPQGLTVDLAVTQEKDCTITVEATPTFRDAVTGSQQLGEPRKISVPVSKNPPAVVCGFESRHVSSDKKTLFVEEQEAVKIDTGLQVAIEDPCASEVDVDITILSNEVEESTMAFMKRMVEETTGKGSPALFVSANRCHGSSSDGFCAAKGNIESRVYHIHVKATDTATGMTNSDVCRVVVLSKLPMEKTAEARELRGSATQYLTSAEEEQLAKSTKKFEVASLSLSMPTSA